MPCRRIALRRKNPIGGQGVPTPDLPKTLPSPCNSLEEVSSVLWTTMEKLLKMSSSKEKEVHSQLQMLTAKRETEKKEAHNLALKYNKVVVEHNNQMGQAKSL